MLNVSDIRKTYGTCVALDGASLAIESANVLAVLGRNGAGKTTLVSIIAGLRKPDRGSVHIGGVDALTSRHAIRRKVGLAPQETGVIAAVSVRENLTFFARLAGLSRSVVTSRVDELAHSFGLTELMDREPRTMSGGERRRLHTAIALVNRPPLLLLDEPTLGADVETRARLLDEVKQISRSGTAVLYTTHYLHEVETLGADVLILESGSVIASGSLDELVAAHGTATVTLSFVPPAPDLPFHEVGQATVDGTTVKVRTERPDRVLPWAIHSLGASVDHLRSVDITRPSLESVYLNLTQAALDSTPAEPSGVPAGGEL